MRFILLLTITLLSFSSYSCVMDTPEDTVTASGAVKDSTGKGISGVKIEASYGSDKLDGKTTSNGEFVLTIPAGGTALFVFSKDGYNDYYKSAAFKGGSKITLDVVLTPSVK